MAVNGIDESGPCGSRGSFRLERPPFMQGYIEACARHLAAAVGPDEVLGIILCGSFSLGEGGVSLDPPKPLLIGDIDILVVLKDLESLERSLPRRYELGRSCESLTEEMEFLGRVEVGFMLPADLGRMPPRPGVLDLKKHGVVLHGREDLLDLVPDYERERIGGRESVTLLENRMASLLGCYGEREPMPGTFPYFPLYEIARVYTDIATAILSLSGLYTPGYMNRSRLLEESVTEGRLIVPVQDDLVTRVSYWTEFKINPTRSFPVGEPDSAYVAELWDDAAGCILSCWSSCESLLQGREPEDACARRLLSERERTSGIRTNLRAWRDFLAGKPVRSRLAGLLGAGRDLYRRDPSSMVRDSAVRLIERYVEGKVDTDAGGMRGCAGSGRSGWEDAAAEVSALWREIVFGRREA